MTASRPEEHGAAFQHALRGDLAKQMDLAVLPMPAFPSAAQQLPDQGAGAQVREVWPGAGSETCGSMTPEDGLPELGDQLLSSTSFTLQVHSSWTGSAHAGLPLSCPAASRPGCQRSQVRRGVAPGVSSEHMWMLE